MLDELAEHAAALHELGGEDDGGDLFGCDLAEDLQIPQRRARALGDDVRGLRQAAGARCIDCGSSMSFSSTQQHVDAPLLSQYVAADAEAVAALQADEDKELASHLDAASGEHPTVEATTSISLATPEAAIMEATTNAGGAPVVLGRHRRHARYGLPPGTGPPPRAPPVTRARHRGTELITPHAQWRPPCFAVCTILRSRVRLAGGHAWPPRPLASTGASRSEPHTPSTTRVHRAQVQTQTTHSALRLPTECGEYEPVAPTAKGSGVMRAKEWDVRITIHEDEQATHAEAVLTATDTATLVGRGDARRNPVDRPVPVIGDELAASRALDDLSAQVHEIVAHRVAHLDSPLNRAE